jgi:hypothetical protein
MTELQLQYCNEKGLMYIKPENTEIADYVNWLEAKIQALRIHDVVGRSEQFKCHSCGTNHSGKNDDQLFEICKTCFDGI